MPSAKQIAWRKKFARMSKAGAFKKKQSQSKSAKNPKTIGAKSNPHGKTNFTLADYEKNEDINYHAENALELVKKYGTKAEIKKIEAINKRHHARGFLEHGDSQKRYLISDKYYKNLVAESKK
jgi:hypothetical protein